MPFVLSGAVLILWAFVNTFVDIREYGWAEGNYWWFCNLALLGMGIGLVIKSRGVLTGFLSIASFTQTFWLIDNIYRQTTSQSLFGLTDFMYRPGYPLEKFVLSHYHYFTILIGAYALCFLPKEKNRTLLLSAIFNPFIFLVSYFAFGPAQNVNCIHSSCLPALVQGEGPLYALSFWFGIFCVHLAIAHYMDLFFLNLKADSSKNRIIHFGFGLGFLLAISFSVHDIQYRKTMPQFVCKETKAEGVFAHCLHTRPLNNDSFFVTYQIKNEGYMDKFCKVILNTDGTEKTVDEGVNVLLGTSIEQTQILPVPKRDMVVQVKPQCSDINLRSTASSE